MIMFNPIMRNKMKRKWAKLYGQGPSYPVGDTGTMVFQHWATSPASNITSTLVMLESYAPARYATINE
jgi:hypothetical protein